MYSNAATRGKMGFTPPSPISVGKPPATKSEVTTSSGFLPSAGVNKPSLSAGLTSAFSRCYISTFFHKNYGSIDFLVFVAMHSGLQEVSEIIIDVLQGTLTLPVLLTHWVDFGINVLHSGELVAPAGGTTRRQAQQTRWHDWETSCLEYWGQISFLSILPTKYKTEGS